MADNFNTADNTPKVIRTNEINNVHWQVVKLDVGGEGVSDQVNGAVPTGNLRALKEDGAGTIATTAITPGHIVSGQVIVFPNCARFIGTGGLIEGIKVTEIPLSGSAVRAAPLTLLLYRTLPTPTPSGTSFAPTSADVLGLVASQAIAFANVTSAGYSLNRIGPPVPFITDTTTSLYGVLLLSNSASSTTYPLGTTFIVSLNIKQD
jgi:hypothetical protein